MAVMFTFSSCLDKDEDPTPKTNKELLTFKSWKVTKVKEDGIDVSNEPEVAFIKNSRTQFNSNGTYTQTTTNYTSSGIWEFANNETQLVFDPNTQDEENWEITELIDNSLKMRSTWFYEDESGNVQTALVELEMVYAE